MKGGGACLTLLATHCQHALLEEQGAEGEKEVEGEEERHKERNGTKLEMNEVFSLSSSLIPLKQNSQFLTSLCLQALVCVVCVCCVCMLIGFII